MVENSKVNVSQPIEEHGCEANQIEHLLVRNYGTYIGYQQYFKFVDTLTFWAYQESISDGGGGGD